jgi:hypothetical protein
MVISRQLDQTQRLFKVLPFGVQCRDIWEVIVQLLIGDRYSMRLPLISCVASFPCLKGFRWDGGEPILFLVG